MHLVVIVIITGGIGTNIVTIVADATKQLQQRYISSRFSSSVDEWPPYQPKHYTTLAFIHDKGKFTDAVRLFVAQKLAVAGHIDTSQFHRHLSLNANMTKNISDIFLPVIASDEPFVDLRILIEGAPGIGKTVLAKEIAYQWAKKELLTSKKLLLLVFLRECHQKPLRTIEDLVQYAFKSSEITTHITKYLSRTDGKDAVIVFDGYDELSNKNRSESIILDIICRNKLTKVCLVITSRPTASSNLHGSVDRRVEIVGFTEEDRLNYIQTALENHDEHVEALQYYLQSNPTINALCYIPLNMTALLCLAKDGIDKLPKTQTEMYRLFLEMTIVRFIKRHENHSTIIDIAKLPHPHDKVFLELAKLAYEALKTDKIVFTLPEIEEECPNLIMTTSNWNGLGLLKAVQCFSTEVGNDQVTFHFLHFSIQEYMAAWYISKLSDRKQIKLLQKTFWEHRYYNTWIMYVGITCGNSFALKHFLSDNRFQFYSKLFKSSKISNRFLKNKMKCLHLFQCLVEAKKETFVDSVKQLFQNKQIDLSNETLLPCDLNTLGFFLIRSINKEWDVLNLSSCNIGNNGSNILCDAFMDKEVCRIVTIKTVNFSYNQLDFSSLMQLFGLFNSWHTSEIIITDDALLDNIADINTIEDAVLQSNTLTLVFIGSFLFSKKSQSSKVFDILSTTTSIKSMYLLNCCWKSNDYETLELLALLGNQKLHKVRIIDSSLNKIFIKKLASILLNNSSVNMLVYDSSMSDEIANDISSLITSSIKDISGLMLVVSSSKVQGIVNTCSLSNELSALELFNLNTHLTTKTSPWTQECTMEHHNNYTAIDTFVLLLHKMNIKSQLKIIIVEDETLIVHDNKIVKLMYPTDDVSVIYLSDCDVTEYDSVIKKCSTVYVFKDNQLQMARLRAEMHHSIGAAQFIATLDNITTLNIIEITNFDITDEIASDLANVLYHNTELQELHMNGNNLQPVNAIKIAKVLQDISMLRVFSIYNNNINDEAADDIAAVIKHNTNLQQLNICNNNFKPIGTTKIAKALEGIITFTKLYISDIITDEATESIATVVSNNVVQLQELVISGSTLQTTSGVKITEAMLSASALNLSKLSLANCSLANVAISNITTAVQRNTKLEELDIHGNNLQEWDAVKFAKGLQQISSLKKLYIHCNSITCIATKDIATAISNNNHLQELNISENNIQDSGAKDIASSLLTISTLTKLNLCDNNITAEAANDIALALKSNRYLQELDISKNNFKSPGITIIAKALQSISTLRKLCLDNNNITFAASDDIAVVISCNTSLQEFNIGSNNLQASGVITIASSLQKTSTLTKLYLNDNNITDEAAEDIATVILCNTKLEEFVISGNKFQATATTKIACALQEIPTLKKLTLS